MWLVCLFNSIFFIAFFIKIRIQNRKNTNIKEFFFNLEAILHSERISLPSSAKLFFEKKKNEP